MRDDSALAPAVAAGVARWLASRPLPPAAWQLFFPGVRDTAQLAGMSPVELGAAWLAGKDGRLRIRQTFDVSGCDSTVLRAYEHEPAFEILAASLRDSAVFITYRQPAHRSPEGVVTPAGQALVMQVKSLRNSWQIDPDNTLLRGQSSVMPNIWCTSEHR